MKPGDLGSSPSFAIIFEFYIDQSFHFSEIFVLSPLWDSWIRSVFFPNLESTEKVIKIQELFPVSYEA